jgi:hypothetical protein
LSDAHFIVDPSGRIAPRAPAANTVPLAFIIATCYEKDREFTRELARQGMTAKKHCSSDWLRPAWPIPLREWFGEG